MFYVYLLETKRPNRCYYIGYTSDLQKRIKRHQNGFVKSTKSYLPVKLVYYESFNEKYLALKREKSLKKGGSAYYGLMKRLKLSNG